MSVEVAAVYLHAPFCTRRCFYCDFAVSVRRQADPGPWLDALAGEVAALTGEGRARLAAPLDTVYLGGGTPSLLGPHAAGGVRRVLAGPGGVDRVGPGTEFTAEANPESFNDEVATRWVADGVNRLSLGTQSFQEPVLRWMGRLHGADGAAGAVTRARRAGLDEVSVDLIFGLPAAVPRDWSADLDTVLALDVPHVSLYGLTAEEGTPLGRQVRDGRIAMPDDDRYRDEYLEAHHRLTAAGYEHYEVSNFARPGHRSRHNGIYWSGEPYLGLGNGAHSFIPPVRRWNHRDFEEYRGQAAQGELPVAESETVSPDAARLENVWLGLRTDRGIAEAVLTPAGSERVEGWLRRGLARRIVAGAASGATRIVLTAEGWLLLDQLAVELEGEVDPRRGAGVIPPSG